MWKMQGLNAWGHSQLWHWQVGVSDRCYRTACGLCLEVEGSATKSNVPAGACSKCLKALLRSESCRQGATDQAQSI